jgi:hypothetical protein
MVYHCDVYVLSLDQNWILYSRQRDRMTCRSCPKHGDQLRYQGPTFRSDSPSNSKVCTLAARLFQLRHRGGDLSVNITWEFGYTFHRGNTIMCRTNQIDDICYKLGGRICATVNMNLPMTDSTDRYDLVDCCLQL